MAGQVVTPESSTPAPPAKSVQMTADSMDADKDGNAVLRGNVVIMWDKITLLADKASMNQQTKQAHAEGNVRLRLGYKEWKADVLDYNFETGAVKAGKARAQLDNGIFFEGESMESEDRSRYILKNSYLTTSDYDDPGYRFKAGTIIVHPNNRVAFHDLVLFVGPIPVFYFPYLVWPLDDEEAGGYNTGTQVQIGSKGNWGFFILNSYTTRASESIRPTWRLDYREQRGLAGGVDLRYKAGGDPKAPHKPGEFEPRVSGKIRAYYADDEKIRKSGDVEVVTSTAVLDERIAPERYQFRVSQRADLQEDIYSKLKADKLSDPNFREDFFEREFQHDPQPDNFFEFTKWSPNTTLSLMARPQVNDFYTTTERLPELRFDLKRQPLFGSSIFYEGENSAARLGKEFANNTPGFSDYQTTRVDSFHQILYPKQHFGWLNLVPRAGGRATFYDESPVSRYQPAVVRGVFNAGIEASFKLHRTWSDATDKEWEIDGLRHIIEPGVNYGFVMRPGHQPAELYQFDVARSSSGVAKNLAPIDFPQFTGVDSIDKRNVFRPAVRQRVQTRRDGATWDLAELLVYQDILADKVATETTFSDLFTEFSMKPVRWFALDWRGRYDYDHDQIRESTTASRFYHEKDWSFSLAHRYFREVGNEVGVGFSWAVNEDWTFRSDHRFDPSSFDLFEQAYAIDRDLHSWIATLSVSQLRPADRDSDLRIWFVFTLKAFPEATVDSTYIGSGN